MKMGGRFAIMLDSGGYSAIVFKRKGRTPLIIIRSPGVSNKLYGTMGTIPGSG
jgi:hypothetical protein